MQDLGNTQFFCVEKDNTSVRLESDRGIYYVRRSYIYYQSSECQKPDHEIGER